MNVPAAPAPVPLTRKPFDPQAFENYTNRRENSNVTNITQCQQFSEKLTEQYRLQGRIRKSALLTAGL
jgi:hypothetical protein